MNKQESRKLWAEAGWIRQQSELREFPASGEYVEVTLSNGEKDYAVWIGHGFMLCEKATARSHGHCVGMATDPFWVSWESLD